jgi:3-carboxy-cis,cis-muconate cycloisomerase
LTFDAIFVPDALRDAVSDRAWVQAMLDAERALAVAEARAGVIPEGSAAAIADACRVERFDVEGIVAAGRAVANPAEPLVRALRETVGGTAADHVHWGATSQDVVDTAAMLVARRAATVVLDELAGVAEGCAALAARYRATPLAGRTLLQHAVPTTFGLKAAGWLVAVLESGRRLSELRSRRLAAQLGGAAGTLAWLGDRGPQVLRAYAEELELAEPELPWHANRVRIAELGAALDVAAGVLAKIALDVALLSQSEVGEVAERSAGGSSTMPQKQNPVGSTVASACARLAHAHASVLLAGLPQEHERGVGGWQSEWTALSGALALTGGAAAAMREVVAGLEVDAGRMRRNLEATGGGILAERVTRLLAERIGRREAHALVAAASIRAAEAGRPLRDELLADPRVDLGPEELEEVFEPTGYLGSAETFVDRALELYRRTTEEGG